MNWKVLWVTSADRQLTTLRATSPNPVPIELAALEIERQLATDPIGIGEARDLGTRILFQRPLGVLYRVYTLSKEVDVLRVWQIAPV